MFAPTYFASSYFTSSYFAGSGQSLGTIFYVDTGLASGQYYLYRWRMSDGFSLSAYGPVIGALAP